MTHTKAVTTDFVAAHGDTACQHPLTGGYCGAVRILGICDERALRQAQRVCSAFGPTVPRLGEPPSPRWASPLLGQDRKLGTQNRSLTAADHRGGAGVGEFDQQPVDTLASLVVRIVGRSSGKSAGS